MIMEEYNLHMCIQDVACREAHIARRECRCDRHQSWYAWCQGRETYVLIENQENQCSNDQLLMMLEALKNKNEDYMKVFLLA
jgi:hypothetical protein